MAGIADVVTVNITTETTPISRQGFSRILIVGDNPTFSERIQVFPATTDGLSQLAAVLTAGVADEEYIAASAIVAQNPRPTTFSVGREDVGDATITVTLAAIVQESNDWFGLVIIDRTSSVQDLAGQFAATNRKLFACASADSNIIDQTVVADTTSIAALLKNGSNNNSVVFYKADAATKFSDAAFLGRILALPEGTYTGKFKNLNGETIDTLTGTQITNTRDKNCNIYITRNVNMVEQGNTSGGEFADVVVFLNYLIARIQENIFGLLVNSNKVPFDDAGIGSVDEVLQGTLKQEQSTEGVPRGITADVFDEDTNEQTGGFFTTVPLAADISAVDKANRTLNGVLFTAFLSGAVHFVQVDGILTL